jgi:aldehyde dehydrogenase (NAD+)
MITYDKLFIGGQWVVPSSTAVYELNSASTEELIGSVPQARGADVDRAVAAAREAFNDPSGWAHWESSQRADAVERLAHQLEIRAEEMARRVSSQNGMPISIATELEGKWPLVLLRYYANLLRESCFESEQAHLMGGTTFVRRESIGVVAAIAPWNFPQTLASFKYAPALAAGCSVILKPSPETVLDSFLFAEAVAATDIPPGVINIHEQGPR